jgi:hypothetical protein
VHARTHARARARAGKVEFEEFWHWFTKKRVGLQHGSLAAQLLEARDKAFKQYQPPPPSRSAASCLPD